VDVIAFISSLFGECGQCDPLNGEWLASHSRACLGIRCHPGAKVAAKMVAAITSRGRICKFLDAGAGRIDQAMRRCGVHCKSIQNVFERVSADLYEFNG